MFADAFRSGGPGHDRPALLSIGLNPRIHLAPLQEDQGRGIISLFLGGNDEYGGRNRNQFHDCALLGGADVTVDGRAIVGSGIPI